MGALKSQNPCNFSPQKFKPTTATVYGSYCVGII